MINIDRSSFLPSIDSFQYHIPLTSTPKRSNKSFGSQPLSSTLSMSQNSSTKLDLSISAITSTEKSSLKQKKRRRYHQRRRTYIHSSTITKHIELKYLLYSTRAMKHEEHKQRHYTEAEMKIYVI